MGPVDDSIKDTPSILRYSGCVCYSRFELLLVLLGPSLQMQVLKANLQQVAQERDEHWDSLTQAGGEDMRDTGSRECACARRPGLPRACSSG